MIWIGTCRTEDDSDGLMLMERRTGHGGDAKLGAIKSALI